MNFEDIKLDFITSATDEDYKLHWTYDTLDECAEIIRGHYLLSVKDSIKCFHLSVINDIMYIKANNKILVDYKIVFANNKLELYDLTMIAYNRYEALI